MKKLYSLLCAASILCMVSVSHLHAQTVSSYTFTQSMGTYTPITGTVIASGNFFDDDIFGPITLPFVFVYHGVGVTHAYVADNGYVGLDTMPFCCAYSGNALAEHSNTLSPLGCDLLLASATGSLSYTTLGTAPYRQFVIQWGNYGFYPASDTVLNFQIVLNETTNSVQFVYGNCQQPDYMRSPAVGINGAVNSDVNNRQGNDWTNSTAGTSGTSTMTYDIGSLPSNGLTFTWTPPVTICSGTPSAGIISGPASVASNQTFTLSSAGNTTGNGITYQWKESADSISWTDITGATNSTLGTSQSTDTYYQLCVTCTNSAMTACSNVAFVSTNATANCGTLFTTAYDSVANSFMLALDSAATAWTGSYHWDFGDGTTDSVQSPVHTYAVNNLYNVCLDLINSNGTVACTYCHTIGIDSLGNVYTRVDQTGFTINVVPFGTTGINALPNESFDVYPNPVGNHPIVTLILNRASACNIEVFNSIGQRVKTFTANAHAGRNVLTLPLADLSSGAYLMSVRFDGKQISRAFVK